MFTRTDAFIEQENAKAENTFKLGHNKFSTWTQEEFDRLNGSRNKAPKQPNMFNGTASADSVDWRTVPGVVQPVQDQGHCGSCWTFSAVGAMEGICQIKDGHSDKFSEQQLVDCDTEKLQHDGNMGCNGGTKEFAFAYAAKYGMESESAYPYKGVDQTCMYSQPYAIWSPSGYVDVEPDKVATVKAAIEQQPVAISLAAGNDYFRSYTSGILNAPECPTSTTTQSWPSATALRTASNTCSSRTRGAPAGVRTAISGSLCLVMVRASAAA